MAKKGKGSKRSKSKKKGDEPSIPPDKISEFMIAVKKEELKESRETHGRISLMGYENVKDQVSHIDKLGLKEVEMHGMNLSCHREMDQVTRETIKIQTDSLSVLQNQIEQLETVIDLKSKEIFEISEFARIPDQVLIEEKNVLLRQLAEIKAFYANKAEKLISRHDACIKNTNVRCSRIINTAEDNASMRELARMPEESINSERTNRVLRRQIELLKKDSARLENQVYELEQRNAQLIQQRINIDWDLKYSLPDEMITKLPPLHQHTQPKYRCLATKGKDLDELAQSVVLLEIERRNESMKEFGIMGQKAKLGPTAEMGPTKYYDSVSTIISK